MTEHIGMEPHHAFEDWMRVARAEATLIPGLKLLDVGCGSGRMWRVCSRKLKPKVLIGVEPDERLALEAGVDFNVYFTSQLNFDDGGSRWRISDFDAVSFYGVLEHVDDPAELIREYSDAKKMIFTVPNANSFHRELGAELGMIDSPDALDTQDLAIGHKRVYTLDTLLDLVHTVCGQELGYDLVDAGSIGFKFTSNSEMMMFEDRWDAINSIAYRKGLNGSGGYLGADLYIIVGK